MRPTLEIDSIPSFFPFSSPYSFSCQISVLAFPRIRVRNGRFWTDSTKLLRWLRLGLVSSADWKISDGESSDNDVEFAYGRHRSDSVARKSDAGPGRGWEPPILAEAELARRCSVSPPGEQPPDHEGALDAGEGEGGGAAGGAAERLGVLEARRRSGCSLESGVRRRGGDGSRVEQGREAVHAFEGLDRGVCSAMSAAYGVCLCRVSAPAPEDGAVSRGWRPEKDWREFWFQFGGGGGGRWGVRCR